MSFLTKEMLMLKLWVSSKVIFFLQKKKNENISWDSFTLVTWQWKTGMPSVLLPQDTTQPCWKQNWVIGFSQLESTKKKTMILIHFPKQSVWTHGVHLQKRQLSQPRISPCWHWDNLDFSCFKAVTGTSTLFMLLCQSPLLASPTPIPIDLWTLL